MPKVSVIIPTYNQSGLVKEAVETVLNQTFGDLEIIIIDDGSTDDTCRVIENIDSAKVKYFYKENSGVAEARNLGLRGATIVTGSEGYGHNLHIHSARFFELADNPQEIVIIVTEEESNILFDYLEKEGVQLFYVKKPLRRRNTHIGLVVMPQEFQNLIQFLWVKLMIQALHFSSHSLPGPLWNFRLSRPSYFLVAFPLELELLNFQFPFGTR